MSEVVIGMGQLNARLYAISSPAARKGFMGRFALRTVAAMQHGTPRKTAATQRSIHAASVTEGSAKIEGSRVLRWIDQGTGLYGPKHHKIVPVHARALSWTGGTFGPGGNLRLSGRKRSGKAGAGASRITVASTKGMRARPFIDRAVKEAAVKSGVLADLTKAWDAAG